MTRTMIPRESGDIVAYIPQVISVEGSPTKRCESQVQRRSDSASQASVESSMTSPCRWYSGLHISQALRNLGKGSKVGQATRSDTIVKAKAKIG